MLGDADLGMTAHDWADACVYANWLHVHQSSGEIWGKHSHMYDCGLMHDFLGCP